MSKFTTTTTTTKER